VFAAAAGRASCIAVQKTPSSSPSATLVESTRYGAAFAAFAAFTNQMYLEVADLSGRKWWSWDIEFAFLLALPASFYSVNGSGDEMIKAHFI